MALRSVPYFFKGKILWGLVSLAHFLKLQEAECRKPHLAWEVSVLPHTCQASIARLILSILRGQRWGSTRERSLTVPRSFPVLLAYHRETLSSVWKRKVCFLRGSRSLGWSSGCFALSLGSGVKLELLQTKLCPHCSDAHKGCREEMSECPGAHRVALSWG